jgi:membrane protein DedA with SNARE-associated domain
VADSGEADRRRRGVRPVLLVVVSVAGLVAIAVVLRLRSGGDVFSTVDAASGDLAYLAVFLLVFGDALLVVLPGETTLNAASTLAAEGVLNLGLVMLAGAAGAVCGDSVLYWTARRNRKRLQPRVDAAASHARVATALDFIGSSAALLLMFGRYVPGLRFVVNATFGLSAHPYRHFLVWSAAGGITWSVYTCGLAYLIGTALAGFPLASVIIAGTVTTVGIAVIYTAVRRHRRALADAGGQPA